MYPYLNEGNLNHVEAFELTLVYDKEQNLHVVKII